MTEFEKKVLDVLFWVEVIIKAIIGAAVIFGILILFDFLLGVFWR